VPARGLFLGSGQHVRTRRGGLKGGTGELQIITVGSVFLLLVEEYSGGNFRYKHFGAGLGCWNFVLLLVSFFGSNHHQLTEMSTHVRLVFTRSELVDNRGFKTSRNSGFSESELFGRETGSETHSPLTWGAAP